MRRDLLLVRHAKSAWDDPSLGDHDRPLAPRGVKALDKMRRHLDQLDPKPDVVLCSTARRTVATLEGLRVALPAGATTEITSELYLASAGELLARLHELDDAVRCAMIIGHNPGIEDLALLLAGSGAPRLRAQLEAKVPTGAIVELSFGCTWPELADGAARIDGLFLPRPTRA